MAPTGCPPARHKGFGVTIFPLNVRKIALRSLRDPRRIDLVIRFIETKSGSVKFSTMNGSLPTA